MRNFQNEHSAVVFLHTGVGKVVMKLGYASRATSQLMSKNIHEEI